MFDGKTVLLAVITPCSTGGLDATKTVTTYKKQTTDIVTDLRAVECIVGVAHTREEGGIIDRSGSFQRTEFVQPPRPLFNVPDEELGGLDSGSDIDSES